jgi:hypothetical protein
MSKRRVIAPFAADCGLTSAAISPLGETIVAGDVSGKVHILRLEGK